jgi:hypothetical protein
MLAIHSGMRELSGYITRTAILVQIAVVSQNMWTFSSYDGSDVILTGREVPGHVNWTRLAGFQNKIIRRIWLSRSGTRGSGMPFDTGFFL